MTQTMKLFHMGIKQIFKDGIMIVLLPTPILVGLLFKFGIPFGNALLEAQFSFSLTPWYGLVDGILICLTPMFMAMISAFLLLDERDEGVGAFYQITPTAGYTYLMARVGLPMLWALVMTNITILFFNISGLGMAILLTSSFIGALIGIGMSMMVVSLAGNRVEGMALAKLIGASLLGLPLVWFVPTPYAYFFAFLPSFWLGKIIMDGLNILTIAPALLVSLAWIAFFTKKFLSRIA
jgi:fluoroquinolone transport system permease protein